MTELWKKLLKVYPLVCDILLSSDPDAMYSLGFCFWRYNKCVWNGNLFNSNFGNQNVWRTKKNLYTEISKWQMTSFSCRQYWCFRFILNVIISKR